MATVPHTRAFIQQDPNNSRYSQRLSNEQWAELKPMIMESLHRGKTIATILLDLRSRHYNITRSQLGTQLKKWRISPSNEPDPASPPPGPDKLFAARCDDEDGNDLTISTFLDSSTQKEQSDPPLPKTTRAGTPALPSPDDRSSRSLWNNGSPDAFESGRLGLATSDAQATERDIIMIEKQLIDINTSYEELWNLTPPSTMDTQAPDTLKSKSIVQLETWGGAMTQTIEEELSLIDDAYDKIYRRPDDAPTAADVPRDCPSDCAASITSSLAGLTLARSCTSSLSSGFRSFKGVSVRIRNRPYESAASPRRIATSNTIMGEADNYNIHEDECPLPEVREELMAADELYFRDEDDWQSSRSEGHRRDHVLEDYFSRREDEIRARERAVAMQEDELEQIRRQREREEREYYDERAIEEDLDDIEVAKPTPTIERRTSGGRPCQAHEQAIEEDKYNIEDADTTSKDDHRIVNNRTERRSNQDLTPTTISRTSNSRAPNPYPSMTSQLAGGPLSQGQTFLTTNDYLKQQWENHQQEIADSIPFKRYGCDYGLARPIQPDCSNPQL